MWRFFVVIIILTLVHDSRRKYCSRSKRGGVGVVVGVTVAVGIASPRIARTGVAVGIASARIASPGVSTGTGIASARIAVNVILPGDLTMERIRSGPHSIVSIVVAPLVGTGVARPSVVTRISRTRPRPSVLFAVGVCILVGAVVARRVSMRISVSV